MLYYVTSIYVICIHQTKDATKIRRRNCFPSFFHLKCLYNIFRKFSHVDAIETDWNLWIFLHVRTRCMSDHFNMHWTLNIHFYDRMILNKKNVWEKNKVEEHRNAWWKKKIINAISWGWGRNITLASRANNIRFSALYIHIY